MVFIVEMPWRNKTILSMKRQSSRAYKTLGVFDFPPRMPKKFTGFTAFQATQNTSLKFWIRD